MCTKVRKHSGAGSIFIQILCITSLCTCITSSLPLLPQGLCVWLNIQTRNASTTVLSSLVRINPGLCVFDIVRMDLNVYLSVTGRGQPFVYWFQLLFFLFPPALPPSDPPSLPPSFPPSFPPYFPPSLCRWSE